MVPLSSAVPFPLPRPLLDAGLHPELVKHVSSLKDVVTVAYRRREGGIREAAAAALQGAEVERSVQLSCGEHTDYGLLTLVNQDTHVSALQVCCQTYMRSSCGRCAVCLFCGCGSLVWLVL